MAQMEKYLDFSIDKNKYGDNAEFSFLVKYFDTITVKFQPFSKNNSIAYDIERPGFYSVETVIKEGDELNAISSSHTYIEPADTISLNDPYGPITLGKEISRARSRNIITPFRVDVKSQLFDFIYFPSRSDRLFILCPSAIIPGKFPVPYFYRWLWAAKGVFPGNVIVFSDPTFLLDPRLGATWLIGTRDNDATLNFTKIVLIFCKTLKLPFKNIIFWGSSAGGFVAMQLSKYFPGSSAVAVNAQTDVYKYPHYGLLYRLGFPGMTDEEINRQYPGRLATLANMEDFKRNRILMVQNILDEHHYEEHFKPFIRKATGNAEPPFPEGIWAIKNSPFTFWLYSHPEGHMAETPQMTAAIFEILGIDSHGENEKP